MLLKNQSVVDFISHDLMDTPNSTYKIADADWNGTRSDVLYMPPLSALGSLPPLLIEIQHTIDSQFMQRLIGYSLNVVKVHKTLPVVLVFNVSKTSPSNLLLQFTPSDEKPWLFSFPCTMWAKHCYLVSKETIHGQDSGSPLSPVMALSLFLAEQKTSLYLHSHPHDPTIIQLYEIAFALVCHDRFRTNFFFVDRDYLRHKRTAVQKDD